ncbi:hypothetical protein DFH11DRAFT_1647870 [Phellopilus nigrolimitatus]|nr:hypothetical protein DFH11DRAFT_1647870 [Phellopilus nigrolimitatus]
MNVLGLSLGIDYSVLQDSEGNSFLTIGFYASGKPTASLFFTSMSPILFIIFKRSYFAFAVSMFQEQRTGHTMFDGSIMPTLKGIVWISAGVKLWAEIMTRTVRDMGRNQAFHTFTRTTDRL